MSKNPFNLAIRFILEMIALLSVGIFSYHFFARAMGVIAAIFLPLAFAIAWGVFAVRGDPSRSGKAVVATPGPVRLVLELVLFGLAVVALLLSGYSLFGLIYGIAIILHYVLSLDRVKWLLQKNQEKQF